MKLTPDEIKYIQNVVHTAQMVGIDNIIIEPNLVRALDDNKTVVILQTDNVPAMSFGSIGLNRINVFNSRIDIAKTQDNFTIEAVADEGEEFTRALTMKGKGVRIDYRCANPSTIAAPRQVTDTMLWSVKLNAEAVLLLQKGQAAMGAENVSIISNDGVSLELVDVNNDVFSHTFAPFAKPLTDNENAKFAYRYPVKTVLPLFKHDAEGTFEIGEKGILKVNVNGLDIYVLPQV